MIAGIQLWVVELCAKLQEKTKATDKLQITKIFLKVPRPNLTCIRSLFYENTLDRSPVLVEDYSGCNVA